MTVIFNEKGRRMRTRTGDVKDTFTVANSACSASTRLPISNATGSPKY